jgi:Uma2 family endonuclease
VEILSPSTVSLDRDLKRARYLRGGVPEYWIVDLDERVVEQFVLEGEEYRFLGAHPNAVVPRSLEGLRIDVSGLW